ncbi:hypothetical protein EJ110_NYTH58492 [Nymphaea thermarum]|nr:hypothetical protein EJ110_NYTH58492 [Nymphaea thermarum]
MAKDGCKRKEKNLIWCCAQEQFKQEISSVQPRELLPCLTFHETIDEVGQKGLVREWKYSVGSSGGLESRHETQLWVQDVHGACESGLSLIRPLIREIKAKK